MLLHGWPYDIHSSVDVAPMLAAKGYLVIVPYLRGYGTTTFLSSTTPRNGQQSVVALDIIALMHALKIEQAILAGFDWGARTADILAAFWPERCKAAGSDVIRSMAKRAGATITEVEGSHVIMISQPQVVTDVILSAIAAVS
jgi:pimeloyl-ACP methyl ester carboxylesterase